MGCRAILVTGTRSPAAADIAWRLKQGGHCVHAGDSTPIDLAGGLPGIRYHRLPRARQSPFAYGAAVAGLVARERIDLVVPTCEEIFYLAAAREQGHAIPLFAPDFATLDLLHDKHRFIAFVEQLGMAVPRTERLESREHAQAYAAQSRRFVFKPVYSRFGTQALLGPASIDGLSPTPDAPWVVQERLFGEEVCLYAVASRGRLRAFCAYRPLYRLGKAASYYFEPVQADDGEAMVHHIVEALDYDGQIAFDAIRVEDGRLLPIECNPRATSGAHLLSSVPGFGDCFTGPVEGGLLKPALESDPAMLAAAMILFGLPGAAIGGLGAWRRDFARGRDVLSGRLNLRALHLFMRYGIAAARGCPSLRAVATRDIEWDGEAIHASA